MLIDGKPGTTLPAVDRGLNYGDGLFETMRVHMRRIPLLDRHLARLRAGCHRLKLPYPDGAALDEEIHRLLATAPSEGVLRLVLTRGDGGRGYAPTADPVGRRILSLHALPAPVDRLAVGLCRTRLGSSPALAGLKHLGRLEQVLAAGEAAAAGWDEGLVLDESDHVVEATRHNLFYLRQGLMLTPPIRGAGVAGVMRAIVLETLQGLGIAGGEASLRYDELDEVEEMFLCNAVAGVRAVTSVAGRSLPPPRALPELLGPLRGAGVAWLG